MRSQQRKIEEQRTIIAHLRHQLEKKEQSLPCSEMTATSKIPYLQTNKEMSKAPNEKISDMFSDSDSAINTDSGSENGKLPETQIKRILPKPTLSRSLSDVQECKKIYKRDLPHFL